MYVLHVTSLLLVFFDASSSSSRKGTPQGREFYNFFLLFLLLNLVSVNLQRVEIKVEINGKNFEFQFLGILHQTFSKCNAVSEEYFLHYVFLCFATDQLFTLFVQF